MLLTSNQDSVQMLPFCNVFLPPPEILGQGSQEKSTGFEMTASKIFFSLSPWKGGKPHRRIYRITPLDQMSHSLP